MTRTYKTSRKLQEQSGSYFVILPKLWVESSNLKQGDLLSVKFNGSVTIAPLETPSEVKTNGN
jgi:phosphate uptake regulator